MPKRRKWSRKTVKARSAIWSTNIDAGNFPKWRFAIQVMPEAEAATYRFNPFDITKVWSQKDYPLIDVGTIELNRNAANYFADVEQAAFTPANVVPGIGFSPDRLLQGRLFSYGDTQRYRLGINHHQIPVNAPRVPMHAFVPSRRRDAHGRQPRRQRELRAESLRRLRAGRQRVANRRSRRATVDRYDHREDDDYYTQPGMLFALFDAAQRERLFGNIARHINGVPQEIVARQIEHFRRADPAYAEGVIAAMAELGRRRARSRAVAVKYDAAEAGRIGVPPVLIRIEGARS